MRNILNFILQHGTAAHLAILTAAPLYLSSLCTDAVQASVLAWLSVLAALWVVMNPSPRWGEFPRDARRRIGGEIGRDPLLPVFACSLLLAAVRAVNGGLSIGYSHATRLWSIGGLRFESLPGSVWGAGNLSLAGLVSLIVVVFGVRHALGERARRSFLLQSSALSALAVAFWFLADAAHLSPRVFHATPADSVYIGSSLLLFFLFSLVAWSESWNRPAVLEEFILAISAGGLLVGLILCAPPHLVWIALPIGLALLVTGAILAVPRRPPVCWLWTLFALACVALPLVFVFADESSPALVRPFFPQGFLTLRETASSLALGAWRENLWFGNGLGSFPLALGFMASPDDWQVLSESQTSVPNGFVQVLFERGLIGASLMIIALGLMLWDSFSRFLRAGQGWPFSTLHVLGPVALLAVALVSFFESTFAQPAALAPLGAALAVTAAAFPVDTEEEYG